MHFVPLISPTLFPSVHVSTITFARQSSRSVSGPSRSSHRHMSSIPQSFLEDIWIRRTLGLAGYSCLVYDHILTFDKEVEFIWRGPWTVTKVIFLINRYGNVFGQTYMQVLDTGWVVHGKDTLEICQVYNLFSALFMFFSSESIHIIVLMRAWAIWGCRRRVATGLITSYILYLLFTVIMTGFGTSSPTCACYRDSLVRLRNSCFPARNAHAWEIITLACPSFTYPLVHEFQYLDLIGICVGIIPEYIWFLPVACFVLDTVVFATTMRSLWQHSRESRRLYPSPLLYLLVRDAVVFYIISVFFDAFTALTWTVYSTSPKYALSLTLSLNLLCIAGQRLVLNLRGLTARSYGPRSLSAEVDRQIGRINDASPEWWWSSGGKFDSGDEVVYESGSGNGSLGKKSVFVPVGRGVEMMTLDRERGLLTDGFPGQGGPICEVELEAPGLRRSRVGAGLTAGELEAVTEVLRPPDDAHTLP